MARGYFSGVTTSAGAVTELRVRWRTLFRSLAIVSVVICPALVLRILGIQLDPIVGLIAYGAAVVGASFVLAWAAEAAQVDVSGGLAVAVLAVIAVLPEYAVDLYYAYTAGHVPEYTQYAAANMTGSNRLLMGLGWPVVVLVSVLVARQDLRTQARRAGARDQQPGGDRLPDVRRRCRLRHSRDRPHPHRVRGGSAGLVRFLPVQAEPRRCRGTRADRHRCGAGCPAGPGAAHRGGRAVPASPPRSS